MKIRDEKITINRPANEWATGHKLFGALEMLVRMLGVVNGTITIHARGGQLCRGIEIVNKIDVLTVE